VIFDFIDSQVFRSFDAPSSSYNRERNVLCWWKFYRSLSRKPRKKFKAFSQETLELLQYTAWPETSVNCRNVIERSVILCETETFSIDESWFAQQPQALLTAKPKTKLSSLEDSEEQRRT